MDHNRAPVLEALQSFREHGYVPFNPPGHRQGRGVDPRVLEVVGEAVFASDVISLNGLDDRLMRGGVIEQAQELMADAVNAEHAFFSTCGSSLSVKSAMLSVAGPHEKLLVVRHAHKSVISGLILSGVSPVWVSPHWDEQRHLTHPPDADEVRRAFEAEPDAKGMLLVTPTDYGTCGDIQAVADVCHEFGKPLIVDEAWGAHLPFHPGLPPWAMNTGADLCVTSVHKSGAAVEQSSVFHLQGDRIDPNVLKAREDLLGTTSATSLVYATLDGWRRQMVQHGERLLGAALALAESTRAAVHALPGLEVMGEREFVGPDLAASMDPLKIVVDVSGLGISGYQAADWLREHQRVTLGLSDHRRVVAHFTHADDERTATVLVDSLRALTRAAETMPTPKPVDLPSPRELQLETAMLPRDAFFAEVEQVDADRAVGRISAEMITPYPPGAPAVLPGEVITREVLEYVRSGLAAGMEIPDPADSGLNSVRVVAKG
ncbi:aminotransferase class I/II-fold pyridoxal phosphate-dependent enzyme [Saccharothrix coeruleofusca]|uniref:Ornithine decarboxylase n=1 Tax=Saccharothrix coeruleofusca TaxID=33919 RepID=A0A918ALR0_9PSEU|nr:ornithine decarboxylase [Saccharothrix coeruleofusca]MBP2336162.1 arginine/lysine/ornithine decarboxylase [Saccharothrix coeruleofusca]GGP54975.1 ornithine decarboxylase [Saccharothrix coeruleofusca]